MSKNLIINSDDFGISEGVNRGIIEAYRSGIVTSTTVMTNMPDAAKGIPQARKQAPELGLGLHLTLSFGAPVSQPETVPSLVTSDGSFVSTHDGLMEKIVSFSAEDLDLELQAQFDRFVEIAGRLPDHLDSHHRAAYIHPVAFETMMRLCSQNNLPCRRPGWLDDPAYLDELPTNADGHLAQLLREIYEKYDRPRCPDYTESLFFWERGSRVDLLREKLDSLQQGFSELVLHVGYGEDLDEDYNIQRNDELAAAIDNGIVDFVKSHDEIGLATFADMARQS